MYTIVLLHTIGMRTLRDHSTINVTRQKENDRYASSTTCLRDKYGIRCRSTCRLLPTGREWNLRTYGVTGNGPWTHLIVKSFIILSIEASSVIW